MLYIINKIQENIKNLLNYKSKKLTLKIRNEIVNTQMSTSQHLVADKSF